MTDERFVSTFRVSRDFFSWIAEQIHVDLVEDARGTQSVHATLSLSLFPDHYPHHHLFYQVAGRLCLLKNS